MTMIGIYGSIGCIHKTIHVTRVFVFHKKKAISRCLKLPVLLELRSFPINVPSQAIGNQKTINSPIAVIFFDILLKENSIINFYAYLHDQQQCNDSKSDYIKPHCLRLITVVGGTIQVAQLLH